MSRKKFESGKDESLYVHQREKIKEAFEIRELNWTEKQRKFIETALDKETRIIICKSPPGTGKSILSLFCALKRLQQKKISHIEYIRVPLESCSKSIGYIKGEISQKMDPYLSVATGLLYELIGEGQTNKLLADSRIKATPLGFIKGRTYSVCDIICDESEDLNLQELLLLISRLGRFATMYIIGDEKQSNIKNSGFSKVFHAFNTTEAKEQGIHTIEFTKDDCLRNDIMKFVLDTFETLM